jgi:phosphatidylserine/phosphatidylglycerophosphate/cardiolipin synthase-like enzyme
MRPRGVWELSTPRLEDLAVVLGRAGETRVTETQLQVAGFDSPALTTLVGMLASDAARLVHAVLGERLAAQRPELELVWSGPEPAQARARDTSEVVRELFESAEHRVIIAGFAFWDAKTIFETLHRRALAKALEIEFFIHVDPTGANYQMTPASFYKHTWPWNDVAIKVYYDARSDADGEQGAMHAKCVVVDTAVTFITSANFTAAAHDRNVEVGVLVRDVDFTSRVASQWRSLAASGLFRKLASDAFEL